MSIYDIKYEIKRFQNRKTSYSLSNASEITREIVKALKNRQVGGIFDKVFYRYEDCTVYVGNKLANISKNLSERIVILPEIALGNPYSKHNINIYVDLASGVMVVCFGASAEVFIHNNDKNSDYFKNSQLVKLIDTVVDLQSNAYCSIAAKCKDCGTIFMSQFEPNFTKAEIIKNYMPTIKQLMQSKPNCDTLKLKASILKNVWNDKTTHIYKL